MRALSMPARDRGGQLLHRRNKEREQHGAHDQAADDRVHPGLRHGGPDRRSPVRRRARRRRQRRHHEDDGEVGEGVDSEARSRPDRRDQPAADGRSDQPGGVVGDRAEPGRLLGELRRDGPHHDLLHRRARKRAGDTDQKGGRVHLRHSRDVLPRHHGKHRGRNGLADVEQDGQPAPVVAVGQRAAVGREHHARTAGEERQDADRRGAPGQIVDEPSRRHGLHPGSGSRNAAADERPSEGRVVERPSG
jgi:hypothetical protein